MMVDRRILCSLVTAAALALPLGVGAQASPSASQSQPEPSSSASQVSAADQAFMKKAAQGGLAEVQLGQLATQNASDPAVKQFGQRMVDDHGKANDQLKSLAEQKAVTLPSDLNAKDQAIKARLEKLHGAAFDRAYMKDMVKDHTKDVAEFRHESQAAKDSDVKQFAAQTLPTLQDHLKQAKSTDQQVAKANASSQAKKKTGSSE